MNKIRAKEEIRRRVETATDEKTRVKLMVLERAIDSESMVEPTGQIVDITGNVYGYAFGLFGAATEFISDPLAYITVTPIVDDGGEAFSRYTECTNQAFKIDEHQKQACIQLIYAYLGIGGGQ